MFIDTHAHVYSEYYENILDIVTNAKKNKLKYIINNGCDHKSNIEVLELTKKFDILYCALGIHPENVASYSDDDLTYIEENLNDSKVVAIGEIGLDYYYSKDNKKEQINLFEKQLKLAEKYNIPVIVHSREATMDTLNCIKKYKVTGVIHCFSGSVETAREYIKLGFLLGVNGVITFKNSKIKETFKEIDEKNIVFETDCPYLTPEPNRGKQNNPSNVIDTYKYYADYKKIDLDRLTSIVSMNASLIFDKLPR